VFSLQKYEPALVFGINFEGFNVYRAIQP